MKKLISAVTAFAMTASMMLGFTTVSNAAEATTYNAYASFYGEAQDNSSSANSAVVQYHATTYPTSLKFYHKAGYSAASAFDLGEVNQNDAVSVDVNYYISDLPASGYVNYYIIPDENYKELSEALKRKTNVERYEYYQYSFEIDYADSIALNGNLELTKSENLSITSKFTAD